MSEKVKLPLTGGCMCEAVRYEISEVPPGCGICHCKRCQRRTGTAFSMTAPVSPGAITITSGEDIVRWYDPADGGWIKAFCGKCGSALFTRNPAHDQITAVRMGSFDDEFGAKPFFHQYTAYAPDWSPVADDGLPRFPERIPASELPNPD